MKKSGFTLIELSIVLVIISLIVGGIVGGKALIQSAKLHQVSVYFNEFYIAVNNFKLQYDALPGDFNEAEDYWGANCVPGNSCNGNGDGVITGLSETLPFWKHLSLAEIWPNALTGDDGGSIAGFATPGENVPEGPLDQSGFIVAYNAWADTYPSYGKYGHNFQFASIVLGRDYLTGGALKPKEARIIDKKMDDGIADEGKVRPGYTREISGANTDCTGNAPIFSSSGSYNLDSNQNSCVLLFFWD